MLLFKTNILLKSIPLLPIAPSILLWDSRCPFIVCLKRKKRIFMLDNYFSDNDLKKYVRKLSGLIFLFEKKHYPVAKIS